jgi:ketosteroid isomerase-like protein
MGIEENKQAVRDWIDAVNAGREDRILDLLTDDFRFTCMAVQPEWLRHRLGREEFAKVPSTMSQVLVSPIQLRIVDMTAEGSRVALEMATDSMLRNGKRYNNAYHLVIKLRDGKFYEVLEYSCSFLVQSCFGVDAVQAEATQNA